MDRQRHLIYLYVNGAYWQPAVVWWAKNSFLGPFTRVQIPLSILGLSDQRRVRFARHPTIPNRFDAREDVGTARLLFSINRDEARAWANDEGDASC